jgi:hypothetical protein
MRTLKEVIDKLLMMSFLGSFQRKPGELIKHLSKEDREILKTAKSKDFWHRIK